nr:alpha/beta hydrolase [Pseudomonas aeruginosa]
MRAFIFLAALLCSLSSFAAARCDARVPTETVELGDVRLAYQSIGRDSDPALLLVMGLGGQLIHWPDEVVSALCEQGFRVIRYDNRDVGLSAWNVPVPSSRLTYEVVRYRLGLPVSAPYTLTDMAGDALHLLDALDIPQAHVLGASMGGMIGFQLACDRPDLLRSLTIVNSTPEVIPRKPREHLEVAKRKLLSRLLSLRIIGRALGRLLFPKAEQAGLREKIEARWAENDKRAYLASLDAIIGWGVQERLAEIACPTLVISADRDYTPVSLKQAYCERIADARLVVVEDSRHATPMDQPEIFNTTLLGFLADIDKTKEQPCSNVS